MKRFFLPVMTVAIASASFIFTGCNSTDNKDELYAEIRDILDEGEAYKTHETQKDRFVLPNASLETSRALYLPIGGALTDVMKETVGNDYLAALSRKANPKINNDLTKVWTSLKQNYKESWDGSTLAKKNEFIGKIDDQVKANKKVSFADNMKYDYYKAEQQLTQMLYSKVSGTSDKAFNGDEGLKGARAKMKDMIPNVDKLSDKELENRLVEEIIKKVRLDDAVAFSKKSEEEMKKYIEDQTKQFTDADAAKADAKEKPTIVTWLKLTSSNKKSGVYSEYLTKKAAVEKKMNDEKSAAWDKVVEADRKVAAFSTYWVAMIGRRLYPVIIPMVPIPEPVGGILTATTPVADKALGLVTSELEKSDEWLKTSLVM